MSNKKCVREKYLYLSAMLRAREAKMLTRDKAERMIDAPSFDEAAKMLTDCGYKDMSGFTAKQVEETLAEHRAEIFAELARLSPNAEPVEVFRMRYDYHNAKIVIKTEADGRDRSDLMSASGRVSPEILKRSFAEEKYLGLPPVLGKIKDATDSYHYGLLIVAVALILGGIIGVLVSRPARPGVAETAASLKQESR